MRVGRAKRGGLTRGQLEAQQRGKALTRTGKLVCDQKVLLVARVRLAVRAAVRAAVRVRQGGVPVHHHAVAGLASRVVVALRVVPATVMPTVQASHAQRLGVMTGSPKVRQRTSHVWALQSLREATAKPPSSHD